MAEGDTCRECTIEIENGCLNYILSNPRMYLYSGRCAKPLPLTLGPSASAAALFTKTPFSLRGAVGVITYDLLNNLTSELTENMAVMFSVPFDFNLYSNWYAVGIFDMSKKFGKSLYREMYYDEEQRSFRRGKAERPGLTVGPGLTYKHHDVTIRATMTHARQPVMKVQVNNGSNEQCWAVMRYSGKSNE
uniref:DELTA-sagatoxin-Srs1a-like n=1 Tax=Centroberyx gerrardi TaxID=166262 RepID=UPI003AAD07AE